MIDLTLDELMIPALPTFTPEFGTKKVEGGLTTLECVQADMRPFQYQRPIVLTGKEEVTSNKVERNCSFVVPATKDTETTLTIGDATFPGCEARIINLSNYKTTLKNISKGINGGELYFEIPARTCVTFIYLDGFGWTSFAGNNTVGQTVVADANKEGDFVNDSTEFIERQGSGSLTTKSGSALWNYIKDKISSLLNLSGSEFSGTAAKSKTVQTVQSSVNANRYLTFVDSNNSAVSDESVYTDEGITYNPSTKALTVSGNIKGGQIVIPINKPSAVEAGSIWLS